MENSHGELNEERELEAEYDTYSEEDDTSEVEENSSGTGPLANSGEAVIDKEDAVPVRSKKQC